MDKIAIKLLREHMNFWINYFISIGFLWQSNQSDYWISLCKASQYTLLNLIWTNQWNTTSNILVNTTLYTHKFLKMMLENITLLLLSEWISYESHKRATKKRKQLNGIVKVQLNPNEVFILTKFTKLRTCVNIVRFT